MSAGVDDRKAGRGRPRAALPADYAFVVQFGSDSDPSTGRLQGRVEHVTSAQQRRFEDREQMLAFMAEVLAHWVPERQ
jgi:hypothetical protein